MHLRTLLLLPFAALAAAQSDVLFFTRVPNPITDGEAAVILWATNDTTNPVTLTLLQGRNTSNLAKVEVITSAATGGQYIWHPQVSIADGEDYALGITYDVPDKASPGCTTAETIHVLTAVNRQGPQQNYFGPLTIQGASPSAVSTASIASSLSASISATGGKVTLTRNATSTVQITTPKHTHAITTTVVASSSTASVAPAASSSTPPQSGSPARHSSLALVLGAIAALFYFQ